MPRVSVIIPVYNTESYLAECLESVLAQTERDIEVLVVDDGSTDGSLAIERSFETTDARVRVLQQPNARQGAARNHGLREARGTYVYFADSDDVLCPTLLEECLRAIERDGADFVMLDAVGFTDDGSQSFDYDDIHPRTNLGLEGQVWDGREYWACYYRRWGVHYQPFSYFARRDFLLDHNLTFAEGIFYEDNDWTARMYICARRVSFMPKVLYQKRYREGSVLADGVNHEAVRSFCAVHRILVGQFDEAEDDGARRVLYDVLNLNLDYLISVARGPWDDKVEKMLCEAFGQMRLNIGDAHVGEGGAIVESLFLERLFDELVRTGHGEPVSRELPGVRDALEARWSFGCAGCRVGLYGSGVSGKALMGLWRRACGEPKAQVTVIDSTAATGQQRLGFDVVNVRDLSQGNLDEVVVAVLIQRESVLDTLRRYTNGIE